MRNPCVWIPLLVFKKTKLFRSYKRFVSKSDSQTHLATIAALLHSRHQSNVEAKYDRHRGEAMVTKPFLTQ